MILYLLGAYTLMNLLREEFTCVKPRLGSDKVRDFHSRTCSGDVKVKKVMSREVARRRKQ